MVDGITIENGRDCVTMRITGAALDNLKRITEIFGAWDDQTLTPADFLWNEYLAFDDALANLGDRNPGAYQTTLPGSLCDRFRGEADVDALQSAFEKEGFSVVS